MVLKNLFLFKATLFEVLKNLHPLSRIIGYCIVLYQYEKVFFQSITNGNIRTHIKK